MIKLIKKFFNKKEDVVEKHYEDTFVIMADGAPSKNYFALSLLSTLNSKDKISFIFSARYTHVVYKPYDKKTLPEVMTLFHSIFGPTYTTVFDRLSSRLYINVVKLVFYDDSEYSTLLSFGDKIYQADYIFAFNQVNSNEYDLQTYLVGLDNKIKMFYKYLENDLKKIDKSHTEKVINELMKNEDDYNDQNVNQTHSIDEKEILDKLLDKISEHGIDSLTETEKDLLNKLSTK